MEVYIILTFIVCIVLYIVRELNSKYVLVFGNMRCLARNKRQSGFLITFLILAFFASIRDGVGCDYDSYVMHIQKIQTGMPHYMEIGFQWVCRQIAQYNDNPRVVIILFAVATCFFYLKAIWDQSDDVLFSVFIFLTWGYYFMTFNTIRNYFALAMTLYSLKFFKEDKYFRFISIVVIASLFHKSALVCIPVYLAAKKEYQMKHIPLFLALIVIITLLRGPIRALAFRIYPAYLGSAYDTGRVSILNVIKAVIVVVLCGLFWGSIKDDKLSRVYFNLNLFALVFYTALYWVPEISRIGFYMNATTILLLPRLARRVGKINKVTLSFLIGAFSIVLFILLLRSFGSETSRLLPYKSWIIDGRF